MKDMMKEYKVEEIHRQERKNHMDSHEAFDDEGASTVEQSFVPSAGFALQVYLKRYLYIYPQDKEICCSRCEIERRSSALKYWQ